jgi:hypothetical protein
MPTYPLGGPTITVAALLKQPRLLARRLSDLVHERYIADRILMKGSADSVAGGVARYQRAESKFLDRSAETTSIRTEFPRASWSEDLRTAVVEQHGLEVPINGLSIRRNQLDQMNRALVKLSNSVVDYVDNLMVSAFLADPDIPHITGAGWDTDGRVFTDIAAGISAIRTQNQGYSADTLVIHEDQHLDLMSDLVLQGAMPREASVNPTMTGRVAPFLGLRSIYVTGDPQLAGKAILMQGGIVGTIADEQVDPQEGYTTYTPEVGPPISVMVYEEKHSSDHIVRAARWPAMWIAEPGAARVIDSI